MSRLIQELRMRPAIPFLVLLTLGLLSYLHYTGYTWPSAVLQQWKPTQATQVPLRVLPLGDSITQGAYGNGNNGYRLPLRNYLLQSGYTVDFIGTLSDGNDNPNPQHEGHGGHHIKEIQAKILGNGILNQHPNLILLHAGSNDLTWLFGWLPPQDPYEETTRRLDTFLDVILCECPDAVLLLGQIVDNREFNASQRIQGFNYAVEEMAKERRAAGFKVQAVNHFAVSGYGSLTEYIQPDFIHPTDKGYELMATNWFGAIQSLPAKWLRPARESSLEASEACITGPSP